MLVLAGQAVIGDAKQGAKTDFQADFFPSFANRALYESLQEINLAADNTPATGLGRSVAECEKYATLAVGQ